MLYRKCISVDAYVFLAGVRDGIFLVAAADAVIRRMIGRGCVSYVMTTLQPGNYGIVEVQNASNSEIAIFVPI